MKKILIVTTRSPFPLFSGDKLRIYNISSYLSQKNKINVMILSTDNEDIKLPVELESKIFDSKINSIVFTNQFNCAKASVDDACIIISVERDGDDLRTIKENAQKITDQILDEGFLSYFPGKYLGLVYS